MRTFERCSVLYLAAVVAACTSSNSEVLKGNGGSSSSSGSSGSVGGTGGWMGTGGGFSGTVTTTTEAIPDPLTTSCESPWTIRLLIYDPDPVVPRRMYFASCTTPDGTPHMLVSTTVTSSTNPKANDGHSGLVFEADVKDGMGLVPSGVVRQFPECHEMHGIAAKSDCSVVGVLCRRATYASDTDAPTKDMVAAITDTGTKDWLTQPVSADGMATSDEEWLYEWPTGDLAATPDTYVASKAIGSWEYGRQDLAYGEADDTFGLSLKSTVFGPNMLDRHEGDALLIVDRSTHDIDISRGWKWGCAAGHTIFNHLAYNPVGSQYTVTCGTDLGIEPDNGGGFAGIWVHNEKNASKGIQNEPLYKALTFGGGPTSLLPLDDGGYVGVLAGAISGVSADTEFLKTGPVSSIGIARYDATGNLVGNIHWVVKKPDTFMSYPQLAPLGHGRFLLGYGVMNAVNVGTATAHGFRVPGSFRVMQVDADGTVLGPEQTLTDNGWGEQDQLVPLGDGRVGWAYIPAPQIVGDAPPACLSKSLQLSLYESN